MCTEYVGAGLGAELCATLLELVRESCSSSSEMRLLMESISIEVALVVDVGVRAVDAYIGPVDDEFPGRNG